MQGECIISLFLAFTETASFHLYLTIPIIRQHCAKVLMPARKWPTVLQISVITQHSSHCTLGVSNLNSAAFCEALVQSIWSVGTSNGDLTVTNRFCVTLYVITLAWPLTHPYCGHCASDFIQHEHWLQLSPKPFEQIIVYGRKMYTHVNTRTITSNISRKFFQWKMWNA